MNSTFRIILLTYISIGIPNITYTQVSGRYIFDEIQNVQIKSDIVDCRIDLHENGFYEFYFFEYYGGDVLADVLISAGNYKIENKEIIFLDNYNRYKMCFTYCNDYIFAKTTIPGLINKKFIKTKYSIENLESSFYYFPINQQLNNVRLDFNQLHKIIIPLFYGIYENEGKSVKFYLQSDGKYRLEYKNVIISEGTFKRIDNELVLTDTSLHHSFYFHIYEKGLISLGLPSFTIWHNDDNLVLISCTRF